MPDPAARAATRQDEPAPARRQPSVRGSGRVPLRLVRTAARVLLVAFVLAAAGLTLGDRPLDSTYLLRDLLRAALELTPVSPARLSDDRAEFLANVLLFVPLGVLLPLALPRVPLTVLLIVPVAASLAVEVAQLLVVAGRTPDVADLASNSTGGAFGILLGADVLRVLRWRQRRRQRLDG